MNKDILLCGLGGQGIVLASKIIANTAAAEGEIVHSAETIGMAQKGGSVTSHVRIGESFSPLIPLNSADILIAFEISEAVRNIDYLKSDGVAVVNKLSAASVISGSEKSESDLKKMVDFLDANCNCIFADLKEIESEKFLNVAMLGVLASTNKLGFSKESILEEIRKNVPQKSLDSNIKAYEMGLVAGGIK